VPHIAPTALRALTRCRTSAAKSLLPLNGQLAEIAVLAMTIAGNAVWTGDALPNGADEGAELSTVVSAEPPPQATTAQYRKSTRLTRLARLYS
jgi:hypothetical protein